MSDIVVVALIAATPPTLAVLASWWQQRASRKRLSHAVGEIHVLVNSRLDTALKELATVKKALKLEQEKDPTLPPEAP